MFFRKKINFPRNADEAKDFTPPAGRAFPFSRVFAIVALVALLGVMLMSGRYQKTKAVFNGGNLADLLNGSDVTIDSGDSAYVDQDKIFNNLNVNGTLEFRAKVQNGSVIWPKVIVKGMTTVNGTVKAGYSHIGENVAGYIPPEFGGGPQQHSISYSLAAPSGCCTGESSAKLTRGARGASSYNDTGMDEWNVTNGAGGGYGNPGGGGTGYHRAGSSFNVPAPGGGGGYNAAGGTASYDWYPDRIGYGNSGGAADTATFSSDIDNNNFKNGVLYFKIGSGAAGGWGAARNANSIRPKRGGGAINLITNQLNLVSGEISADAEGQNGASPTTMNNISYTGQGAAGGSGGGIFIHANQITGNTMAANKIHASGSPGEAYNNTAHLTGGTGGGGIVLLSYGSLVTDSYYNNFDNSVNRWASGASTRLPLFKKVLTAPLSLADINTSPSSTTSSSLSISKLTYNGDASAIGTVPKATFNPNEDIWVQITVQNAGTVTTTATITDNIFRKESGDPWEAPTSISDSGSYAAGIITWSNITLDANGSKVLTYHLKTP